MKRRSGTMLLSIISLLVIGGAFESQRYANFRERQAMYRLIIQSFDHPEQTVDSVQSNVHKRTKSEKVSGHSGTNSAINHRLTDENQLKISRLDGPSA